MNIFKTIELAGDPPNQINPKEPNGMAERLIIENFAGLGVKEPAIIDLKPINIFIGEHATGKSVAAKLLYYIKQLPYDRLASISRGDTRREFRKSSQWLFRKYFEGITGNAFSVRYYFGKESANNIEISQGNKGDSELRIRFSELLEIEFNSYRKAIYSLKRAKTSVSIDEPLSEYESIKARLRYNAFQKLRELFKPSILSYSEIFIPAVRSIFAIIQENIFSLLSKGEMDPFIVEFGESYQSARKRVLASGHLKLLPKYADFLKGSYLEKAGLGFIKHSDGREIRLSNASSGQQEMVPFVIIMSDILDTKDDLSIYLEEPESHVFPTLQRDIIYLCAFVHNMSSNQFIITTHSPYVLTAMNNLIHAGALSVKAGVDLDKLSKIVHKNLWINPSKIGAYHFEGDKCRSIIDERTGLINADGIDTVSSELSTQFGKLLELEYGK